MDLLAAPLSREARMTPGLFASLAAFVFVVASVAGHARQATVGMRVPPLGAGPFVFDTAEVPKIRVTVVARGLSHPWSLVFLPDGSMLITERPGRIRVLRHGTLDPTPILGVPPVRTDGNGGLMDIALHPRFSENRLVYFTYTKPVGNGRGSPTLARGRLDGGSLVEVRDLLVPGAYDGNSGERPPRLRSRRDDLLLDRRQHRQRGAGPGQPARQDSSARRRRDGAAGQPVRRAGRVSPTSTPWGTATRSP
jgi:hypothetical protein